jgi:hypothetical protein
MSVLGTTALSHACGTQAAFPELSISETGFSKREVDIASPRRRLQIQVDGLSPLRRLKLSARPFLIGTEVTVNSEHARDHARAPEH